MKHRVTIGGAFPLEGGETLTDVTVEVRTWGKHRPNAILICHALTGDANADEWWSGLFGAGKVFDPAASFIVSMNVLGGCAGTTGPTSETADGSGHYGSTFPRVTIRDMVDVQRAVLDSLGVNELDLVIGGSMGGMQVLEWAIKYPDMVDRIVPIAVGAAQSAWAVGFSESQRNAIVTDPTFAGGDYALDAQPSAGLSTARMIAMTSYRSATSFEARFGRRADDDGFAVQSYLQHQGRKLVDRFDANSYLRLIDAMDTHDVGRGRGPIEGILHRVDARGLVIGISTDVLYPVAEVRNLAANLPRCRFAVLDSIHGHDGFLVDVDALNDLIKSIFAETNGADEITGHGSAWA